MGCQSGGVPIWDRIAKLVDPCVRRRHRSLLRRISLPLEVSMVPKYDIFRKTNDSVVWVEAVEDIVTVKKRLITLASDGKNDYRVWDSTREQFIDVLDDCA